jgi:small subunit ribosomal protein S6
MPANVYECMFLLDTNKVAGDVSAAAKQLHTILEKNNAEVLASRTWEDKRLAYPIKNHKKGLYYLVYFRTDGKNLVTIEHDFSLARELILRVLVLHVDPKLVDAMLAVAREEHAAPHLRTVNEPLEGEEGAAEGERGERGEREMEGAGAGGGPRRGPRRMAEAKDD